MYLVGYEVGSCFREFLCACDHLSATLGFGFHLYNSDLMHFNLTDTLEAARGLKCILCIIILFIQRKR